MIEPLHLPRRRPRAPRCAGCRRSLAGERLPVRDLDADGRLRVFHQVCALKRPA
jgi:hypothetical protein